MSKYILSTIAGVESVAKKEIEKQGGKIIEVRDRSIEFEGDCKTMIRVNLWSRVGNKVYEVLQESSKVDDFDKLYELVGKINFKKYFHHDYPIVVKVKSINSKLDSTPAIQKITKKSVIDNITKKSGEKVYENTSLENFEILVLIIDDRAKILLNTTGEALHKRGYRISAGDAPIKENLAAALILLSGWRFKEPFYDVFCGSGTIAIEAAMIARNIAPGLDRYFAFENLVLVDKKLLEEELILAKSKKFEGQYQIFASDTDDEVLEKASINAKNATTDDTITFENKSFEDYLYSPPARGELEGELKGTLVSNPPYGERLKSENLNLIYKNINKLLLQNKDLGGGVITSYFEEFDKLIKSSDYKKRKLYNGGEKCYFYRKK